MRATTMLRAIAQTALSSTAAVALAVGLASAPSYAADFSVTDGYVAPPMTEAAPAAHDWGGLYVGLQGFYGWGDADATFAGPPFLLTSEALDLSLTGAMVGGTVGVNFQLGNNLVLGLEGDIAAGKISGTGSYDPPGFIPLTGGEFDLDWMATLRGRLGVATNNGNTLWYLTGGGAFAHGNRMIVNSVVGVTSFTDGTHTGWTAGGGIEHAINDKWSVKGEYLYADLGSADYFDAGSGVTTSVDVKVHTLKFGINRAF